MAINVSDSASGVRLLRELGQSRLVLGNPREPLKFETYTFNRNGWLVGWYRQGQAYSCGFDGRALRSVRVGEGTSRFIWPQMLTAEELEGEVERARQAVDLWRRANAPCAPAADTAECAPCASAADTAECTPCAPASGLAACAPCAPASGTAECTPCAPASGTAECTPCAPASGLAECTPCASASGLAECTPCAPAADTAECTPCAPASGLAECAPLLTLTPQEVAARFRAVWDRVAILPPDQYAAAVVRLTQGCAYNGCRFCSFYKDVSYRVLGAEEFATHLGAVQRFFGAELAERRGVFLAAANAANVEDARLAQALLTLRRRAEGDSAWERCWRGGVASFLDTFSRSGRTVSAWRQLHAAGLTSLYLGVETGSPALRQLWRKPGSGAEIGALVERLKEAGLKVGVIVLSGAEEEFRANEHNRATARLLNSLPLDGADRIYISEYSSGTRWESAEDYLEYRRRCRESTRELQAALDLPAYPEGPLVSLYDVWQYLYR